ncbi:MAG: hypothetical protein ABFS12_12665 [Bacteroidota bacterium]
MRKIFYLLLVAFYLTSNIVTAQFWLTEKEITPHRLPMANDIKKLKYIDLDDDGDPDVLRYTILDNIPVQWIDDDDDMNDSDIEGDMDSDCLMIDRNKDGQYGSGHDLIIDWNDENSDNKADIQAVVDYSGLDDRGRWQSHYMWVIDLDGDGVFNFIDWNTLKVEAWEHSGQAKFFTDYHGNSIFLKAHTNTFNIKDLRYNWENPFLFYDFDDDGQSEMAIRYVDEPIIRTGKKALSENETVPDDERSIIYKQNITSVQIGIDLDNDNRASNELDYDMSIRFDGNGFDYSEQFHQYNSLRGLPEADQYFFDPRWRQLTELIYVGHENGYTTPFQKGDWNSCSFVYDEDDDCHRWERVEFYDPKDIFKVGAKNGGLDHNPQADVSGDRGEWDKDFSGKGKLYIGKFDGKIHLYGAEWGAWRIDQNATYYQGWQGWRGPNIQPEDHVFVEPETFGTVKYSDSNNNGYFDIIEYDLDGDKQFEKKVELLELGIEDQNEVIDISNYSYDDLYQLQNKVADDLWENAIQMKKIALKYGLNTEWYSVFLNPQSIQEKYHFGYWLQFYLYQDLHYSFKQKSEDELVSKLEKAYYGGKLAELVIEQ